jgi:hypothetical protein
MKFGFEMGEMRLWFAWYPVRTYCGPWVWLETVYKRRYWNGFRYEIKERT